ncbi:MAG TPA: cytochrome C oxidase subunit IV family protein [Gemmatimonadaceae bacterium]|nr:cytochrome C oxidase subunit IV family protein [Gemmatimonadaceae bacterium]
MAHEQSDHAAHDAQAGHGNPDHEHEHPTWSVYWKVGLILTVITILEVWAYYIPSLVASPYFVPMLLVMSAAKFAIVVLFYMHLRYDHRLFKALFTGPLVIAIATLIGLLFLLAKFGAGTTTG